MSKSPVFNAVKVDGIKKNSLDLSYEHKMSLNMGQMIPIMCQEVVPGDSFQVNTELFIRFAPMVFPIMHRIHARTHYFFVSMKSQFDKWDDFIGGGEQGDDASTFPQIKFDDGVKTYLYPGSLADYLGLPTTNATDGVQDDLYVSVIPFRAYQTIYNWYYRDQDLTDEIEFGRSETVLYNEMNELGTLRNTNWEKDYFTSARPEAQKGTAYEMPISGIATDAGGDITWTEPATLIDPVVSKDLQTNATGQLYDGTDTLGIKNITSITVDVDDFPINELRYARAVQVWMEKMSRAGSRYQELVRSFFNVNIPDSRIEEKPEYLGGGTSPVVISEVLASTEATGQELGQQAGHGMVVGGQHGFRKTFLEHGYIIGILTITPSTSYTQGINRHWLRNDKYEWYWPNFAHLGEQAIEQQELFWDFTDSDYSERTTTFGYAPRYAEYKYNADQVSGDFLDTYDDYHLARFFTSAPTLNTSFLECDPDNQHRIFANTSTSDHKLYAQIYHKIRAIRPMPVFGDPTP